MVKEMVQQIRSSNAVLVLYRRNSLRERYPVPANMAIKNLDSVEISLRASKIH